jgi:hypothetical protein
MRAIKGWGAFLIVLGAVLLLGWGLAVSSVGAVGYRPESPVPTSTRPPLPTPSPATETPEPSPTKEKPPSSPPASPTPTPPPSPATQMLPQAGGRVGGVIGGWEVLLGGGTVLALGLALRRERG